MGPRNKKGENKKKKREFNPPEARAPRDIGDPEKARVDTLKWLKGEGPSPEQFELQQFNILLPEDKEVSARFRKDIYREHPERFHEIGPSARGFLYEVEEAEKEMLRLEQERAESEVRVLARKVSTSENKEEERLARFNEGNAEKRAVEQERQRHITNKLSAYKPVKESKLTINGIVKALCRASNERHPEVDEDYVFPHTNEKMENENVGKRTISPRRLNEYVGRALVKIELAAAWPALVREQQTADKITNLLCKGGDQWLYNGKQSIKKTTLRAHVKKLLLIQSMNC